MQHNPRNGMPTNMLGLSQFAVDYALKQLRPGELPLLRLRFQQLASVMPDDWVHANERVPGTYVATPPPPFNQTAGEFEYTSDQQLFEAWLLGVCYSRLEFHENVDPERLKPLQAAEPKPLPERNAAAIARSERVSKELKALSEAAKLAKQTPPAAAEPAPTDESTSIVLNSHLSMDVAVENVPGNFDYSAVLDVKRDDGPFKPLSLTETGKLVEGGASVNPIAGAINILTMAEVDAYIGKGTVGGQSFPTTASSVLPEKHRPDQYTIGAGGVAEFLQTPAAENFITLSASVNEPAAEESGVAAEQSKDATGTGTAIGHGSQATLTYIPDRCPFVAKVNSLTDGIALVRATYAFAYFRVFWFIKPENAHAHFSESGSIRFEEGEYTPQLRIFDCYDSDSNRKLFSAVVNKSLVKDFVLWFAFLKFERWAGCFDATPDGGLIARYWVEAADEYHSRKNSPGRLTNEYFVEPHYIAVTHAETVDGKPKPAVLGTPAVPVFADTARAIDVQDETQAFSSLTFVSNGTLTGTYVIEPGTVKMDWFDDEMLKFRQRIATFVDGEVASLKAHIVQMAIQQAA